MDASKRFENLVAFKTKGPAARFLAFHAKNLEVAEIDELAWKALDNPQDGHSDEVSKEILAWNSSENPEVITARASKTQLLTSHCPSLQFKMRLLWCRWRWELWFRHTQN